MKNTKLMVSLGIMVLIGLSWYTLFSSGIEPKKKYEDNLAKARKSAEMGIYVDANAYYGKAQEIHDNLDLRREIVKYYKDSDQVSKLMSYAENVTNKYPKDSTAYEYLAQEFLNKGDYDSFYEVRNTIKKRKVKSEIISQLEQSVAYDYYIDKTAFADVREISGELWACQNSKGAWGFANRKGKNKIICQYDKESFFNNDGLASVKTSEGFYALVNRDGDKKYTDLEKKNIEDCGILVDGKMYAKINGTYKYLDQDFKVVLEGYEDAGTFNSGVAPVKKDGRWIIINEEGTQVGEESFDDIRFDEKKVAFRNGIAFGRQKGKYYLINTNGEKVSDKGWVNADVFRDKTYAAVCENDKWGFIDNTGNVVIDCQYQLARSYSNGMAGVLINNKWGFINEEGELKIPAEFEDIKYFSKDGNVFVQQPGTNKFVWNMLMLYSKGGKTNNLQ